MVGVATEVATGARIPAARALSLPWSVCWLGHPHSSPSVAPHRTLPMFHPQRVAAVAVTVVDAGGTTVATTGPAVAPPAMLALTPDRHALAAQTTAVAVVAVAVVAVRMVGVVAVAVVVAVRMVVAVVVVAAVVVGLLWLECVYLAQQNTHLLSMRSTTTIWMWPRHDYFLAMEMTLDAPANQNGEGDGRKA